MSADLVRIFNPRWTRMNTEEASPQIHRRTCSL
jgi:hypothetical protein